MSKHQSQVIRLKDVVKLLGISKSSLYLWLNKKSKYYKPDFPARIKLSFRISGWFLADIEKWIQSQARK